jgi:hypothetical protein
MREFRRSKARNELRLSRLGLSSARLSVSLLFRSAAPLASAGIVCLGLVPLLGSPSAPLHLAIVLGMAASGVLLFVRYRLRGAQAPLAAVSAARAAHARRAVFIITMVLTLLVGIIIAAQVAKGGVVAPLSVAMPAVGLLWLVLIGVRAGRRHEAASEAGEAGDTERPSRRPPEWKARASNVASQRPSSDRHVSA